MHFNIKFYNGQSSLSEITKKKTKFMKSGKINILWPIRNLKNFFMVHQYILKNPSVLSPNYLMYTDDDWQGPPDLPKKLCTRGSGEFPRI